MKRRWGILNHCWWDKNLYNFDENQCVPVEAGNRFTSRSSYATHGHILKGLYTLLHIYLSTFTAPLFIIFSSWKSPRNASLNNETLVHLHDRVVFSC